MECDAGRILRSCRAQDCASEFTSLMQGNSLNLVFVVAAGALGASLILAVFAFGRLTGRAREAIQHCFAAMEQSPQGLLVADAGNLKILHANPAAQRALGYAPKELMSLSLPQVFVDETAPGEDGRDALSAKLRNLDPRTPLTLQWRCNAGNLVDIEVAGFQFEHAARKFLALRTNDVTLRRKIETQLLEKQQHLDHLAHHDQLTGLPNRLYLAAHLPAAIAEAKRTGAMLAVLFLDLDRFKHVNDSRGHEVGDKLLKSVAQRIRGTVRNEDDVVRMGGDEFIVVLKNVKGPQFVNETAERINEALAAPVVVDGRPLVTTVSIGVSMYPRDGVDVGELLRHSDTAMYQAKDRGRNNFQLFSPVMDRKLKERIAVEASLRAAIEQKQLDVHYQPIIDIESHRVMGLEALLRWKHPLHGFVAPGRFIGVAEETGLIVPIGEFVLERVMDDAARWREAGWSLVPVAVNISAVQLQRSDLPATIRRLTQLHGLKTSMLQVELTESAVFEHREARTGESSEDAISQLRELGVRIAIDDFGTGYSSLSYLKRWRVDYVKIDRSFVRDLVTDMSDLAIVGAIIAMARHLNIQVVAEGIEGWQQLEKLRHLHCNLAQGYLFAKPSPASQCRRFLTGTPLDLTQDEALLELDATGSYGN
jgi:diguanylate cyclase (GGDEF)-like protein/PAS domain S-box-containing protein